MRGQAAAEMLECSLRVGGAHVDSRMAHNFSACEAAQSDISCVDQDQCGWCACGKPRPAATLGTTSACTRVTPVSLLSCRLVHRALGLSLHHPSCCEWMSTSQPAVLANHPVAAQKLAPVMDLLCHHPARHHLHHLACSQPSVT
jgi:hypothetical protein